MLHDITILLYFDVINATYHDRAPKAPTDALLLNGSLRWMMDG